MNGRQKRQICRAFLELQKGSVLDAMEAMLRMSDQWGVRVDWHEFSDALDEMVRYDMATVVGLGAGRFVEYLIE